MASLQTSLDAKAPVNNPSFTGALAEFQNVLSCHAVVNGYGSVTAFYSGGGLTAAPNWHFRGKNGADDNFRVAGTTGNVTNSNNSYGAISDARLKEILGDLSSQWDDVKALAGMMRRYRLLADVDAMGSDAPILAGWVAQEVLAVSPGLVEHHLQDLERIVIGEDGKPVLDEDGNPVVEIEHIDQYTIKTSVAMLKLFKAFGEAQARIESLEARVEALEASAGA